MIRAGEPDCANPANQFHAVDSAHSQVRHHHVELMYLKDFPSFLTALRRFDFITMIQPESSSSGQSMNIIVDKQNADTAGIFFFHCGEPTERNRAVIRTVNGFASA